jgi:hypothetical protein
VDGTGLDGEGCGNGSGYEKDAERNSGLTPSQHRNDRAEHGTADHDANPEAPGQRTPLLRHLAGLLSPSS